MTTTRVFVELLIIGIGVAIWLFLLIMTIGGPTIGPATRESMSFLLPMLGGIAYVLGIVVDRFSRRLLRFVDAGVKEKIFVQSEFPEPDDVERLILTTSPALAQQIQYNRSRLRICRAWTVNLALIAVFLGTWASRTAQLAISEWTPLVAVTLLFTFATGWTARRLTHDHYNNLRASYLYLGKPWRLGDQEDSSPAPEHPTLGTAERPDS